MYTNTMNMFDCKSYGAGAGRARPAPHYDDETTDDESGNETTGNESGNETTGDESVNETTDDESCDGMGDDFNEESDYDFNEAAKAAGQLIVTAQAGIAHAISGLTWQGRQTYVNIGHRAQQCDAFVEATTNMQKLVASTNFMIACMSDNDLSQEVESLIRRFAAEKRLIEGGIRCGYISAS